AWKHSWGTPGRYSAGATARHAAGGMASGDGEQLDLEHQGGIGTDHRRASVAAVGQLAGDPEPVGGTDRHQGQALGPAGDDLVEAELGGLAACIGTVELGAVEQGAAVVDADPVAGARTRSGTGAQHAVLQARGGGE